MFNLCKLNMSTNDGTCFGHPMSVVMKSDDLNKVSEEIKKRVRDGCPEKSLLVFKTVEFEVLHGIKYLKEEAALSEGGGEDGQLHSRL